MCIRDRFKGRAIMFKERGELLLLKFADSLKDVGALEGLPKMEGKRMLVMFAPVSYTHLDVYKRQIQYIFARVCPARVTAAVVYKVPFPLATVFLGKTG